MALALKKPCCCCGSLRVCTLILLVLYWISGVWTLKSCFSALRNPMYDNFISTNKYTFFSEMVILMIGIFICLLAIISIAKEFQRTIFLLNAIVVLLILYDILLIIEIVLYNSNGTMETLIKAEIEEEIKNKHLTPEMRDESTQLYLSGWNFGMVASILFSLYVILVFYSYNVELWHEAFA